MKIRIYKEEVAKINGRIQEPKKESSDRKDLLN